MTFRGDMEDLESHRGPGLGKVVLDEGQRVWREQSMWEKGLPRRQQCSGAGPCQVGGRGAQGRRLSRQAGLDHPDEELDSNQEGIGGLRLWDK